MARCAQIVAERGRPRWETVLAADSRTPPRRQAGFGELVDKAWRTDHAQRPRDRGGRAAARRHAVRPLPGRYGTAGRLATAARQADETRTACGCCARWGPGRPALLDGQIVGAPRRRRAGRDPRRHPSRLRTESLVIDHGAAGGPQAAGRALETDLRVCSARRPSSRPGAARGMAGGTRAERTAATYETWLDGQVTQAAVAWVLGTVFVRFCEDNGLIDVPYLAGPGERLDDRRGTAQAFFERNPRRPTGTGSSPASTTSEPPRSRPGCSTASTTRCGGSRRRTRRPRTLLAFWRKRGDQDAPSSTTSPTRLGHPVPRRPLPGPVRARQEDYALLQTPEFVEEFILDRTLNRRSTSSAWNPTARARPDLLRTCGHRPGLRLRPLPARRVRRLLDRWAEQAPGTDPLGADRAARSTGCTAST